jgi:hypothetical protein
MIKFRGFLQDDPILTAFAMQLQRLKSGWGLAVGGQENCWDRTDQCPMGTHPIPMPFGSIAFALLQFRQSSKQNSRQSDPAETLERFKKIRVHILSSSSKRRILVQIVRLYYFSSRSSRQALSSAKFQVSSFKFQVYTYAHGETRARKRQRPDAPHQEHP